MLQSLPEITGMAALATVLITCICKLSYLFAVRAKNGLVDFNSISLQYCKGITVYSVPLIYKGFLLVVP